MACPDHSPMLPENEAIQRTGTGSAGISAAPRPPPVKRPISPPQRPHRALSLLKRPQNKSHAQRTIGQQVARVAQQQRRRLVARGVVRSARGRDRGNGRRAHLARLTGARRVTIAAVGAAAAARSAAKNSGARGLGKGWCGRARPDYRRGFACVTLVSWSLVSWPPRRHSQFPLLRRRPGAATAHAITRAGPTPQRV